MNNRSTKDIRVVMMPFDLLCFTIRIHHVCLNVNNFGFLGKYHVKLKMNFVTKRVFFTSQTRKNQTLPHRMKIDDRKKCEI